MNRTLLKNTLRSIRGTAGRFLAIFAIIALGSGFFAGVKVTSPDMKRTANAYYADNGLMDLHLRSTVGFTDAELEALGARDGVAQAAGGYTADVFLLSEESTNTIVKLHSMDFAALSADADSVINCPVLTEGRWPEAADECLLDVNTPSEYAVGDTLTVMSGDGDKPLSDVLRTDTFTAVGRVNWVMYVDFERGTTTIGNGKVNSILLLPEEAFTYEVYTDAYLTLTDAAGLDCYEDAYTDTVSAYAAQLKADAPALYASRAAQLQADADAEIAASEQKLQDGKDAYAAQETAYQQGIADAEQTLAEKTQALADGQTALEQGKATLAAQQKQYTDGVADWDKQDAALAAQEQTAADTQRTLTQGLQLAKTLQSTIQAFRTTSALPPLDQSTKSLIQQAKALDTTSLRYSPMLESYISESPSSPLKEMHYATLLENTENYQNKLLNQQASLKAVQQKLTTSRKKLKMAAATLEQTKQKLADAQAELDTKAAALADGEKAIEDGNIALEQQKTEGKEKLAEAKATLAEGEAALAAAKEQAKDILGSVKWYVFGREDNVGYAGFAMDADRVDTIAKVFPVFFILVAALVCLTTMTRMVEEQRTEIGTLKALGYSRGTIMLQFLLYSMAASILGVLFGVSVCTQIFPRAIYAAYLLMYNVPPLLCPFPWDYAAGSLAVSLLCTAAVSVAACYREMVSVPAQLMRPRAPKNGRRVLLERMPFLWKHLSFNLKVTARNVFRYKNRVLMTVAGVAGCTALMLTGFGLRNAITVIVDTQFRDIYSYDLQALYHPDAGTEALDALRQSISDNADIADCLYTMQKSATVHAGAHSVEAYTFAVEAPERLEAFITLRNRLSGEAYTLDGNGVVITEKLAKLLDVSVGDSLSFDGTEETLQISGITENYVYHYIYMTEAQYDGLFGDYAANSFLARLTADADQDPVSEALLENDCILSLSYTEHAGQTFRELIHSLNYIVLLIIVSSGALAFVVLYNLANINITERMRELATIKVLGFYDKEVAAYIYRENTVSSLLGMDVGLVLGVFLDHFVVETAEIDVVMFYPVIPVHAFVLAGLLTLLFTLLVNALLYAKLKSIDMAGSMKAIE